MTRQTATQHATGAIFCSVGIVAAAWAALVPFAQQHLGVTDGTLGLLLLCLGGGSVAVMPVAGRLCAQHGCRAVITAGAGGMALALPLLTLSGSVLGFALLLLVFGAALGAVDVAMNIQAIAVERAGARAMMSRFHGMFSLGGMLGAGLMAAVLSLGAPTPAASLGIGAVVLLMLAASFAHLLPEASPEERTRLGIPHPAVLAIGALCGIAFLAEGAVLDWSAVFLASVRGLAPSHAGVGYAVFSLTMTWGRLTGDRIVARHGASHVLVAGCLCAAGGFALVALAADWRAALAGFALVGAGCSNIVPILFSAAGRQTAMPASAAVPAVAALGYAGILAGPALIGFVAQQIGLAMALLCVAALLLAGVCGRQLPGIRG